MAENATGRPESDQDGLTAPRQGATTRELCEAASSALSLAAEQLREVVLADSPEAEAAQRLLESVDRQAPGGLHLWLLTDLQLLTVARWLDHRARLLAPPDGSCGDRLQLHGGVDDQLLCELPAGHGGNHTGGGQRWVDLDWRAEAGA